jgi:hypothetical protein
MRLYSVYYISVGSSTCFGCWHPSSGTGTAVITASGIDWLDLLPSALVVELELIHVYRTVGIPTYLELIHVYPTVGIPTYLALIHVYPTVGRNTYRTIHMNQFQLNNQSGWQ